MRLGRALIDAGREAAVINADSAQVYADLQVLSARPSEADMRGVPHRLFGSWDGADACDAAEWADAAKAEIARAHDAGAVPILVGGTGMYIRTLIEGIAPVPPIDDHVRSEVRAMATPDLSSALEREDPAASHRIAPADRQRMARALEVVRSTGRTLEQWQQEKAGGIGDRVDVAAAILLSDREPLYARCDARFAWMMDNGAIEEVERLMDRGLDPFLPVMGAIGVREIAGYVYGKWSRDEAIAMGQQATRNYAKRQYTWLRHQPPADWPRIAAKDFTGDDAFETLCSKLALT